MGVAEGGVHTGALASLHLPDSPFPAHARCAIPVPLAATHGFGSPPHCCVSSASLPALRQLPEADACGGRIRRVRENLLPPHYDGHISKAPTSCCEGFGGEPGWRFRGSSQNPGLRQYRDASEDYDCAEAAASRQSEADGLSECIRTRSANYCGSESAQRAGGDNCGSQAADPFQPEQLEACPTEKVSHRGTSAYADNEPEPVRHTCFGAD